MFKSRHATASAAGPIVTKIGMMILYSQIKLALSSRIKGAV